MLKGGFDTRPGNKPTIEIRMSMIRVALIRRCMIRISTIQIGTFLIGDCESVNPDCLSGIQIKVCD